MIEILPNWHPVFVHFTVALLSVSLLVFIFSFVARTEVLKDHAQIVARWTFWIAVIATFATVVAGWFAYNSVAHDTPSHAAMTEHKNWAFITSAILLVVAAAAWWLNHHVKVFAIGLIVVVTFMGITAWHGGELVYRYGLGVMSMPMTEGEGHGHDSHDHATPHTESANTVKDEPLSPTGDKKDASTVTGTQKKDDHSTHPHSHDAPHQH